MRERALRILSDLCYAYITTAEVDAPLDNNDSEFDQGKVQTYRKQFELEDEFERPFKN